MSKGFTLIELLVVVALVAVLASIGYPTYIGHMKRVYRAQIAGLLTGQAQALERHFSRKGTFIDAANVIEGNDRYRISVVLNPQDFTLIATPVAGSVMATDGCASFSLTSIGARSNPGAAPGMTSQACWGQ